MSKQGLRLFRTVALLLCSVFILQSVALAQDAAPTLSPKETLSHKHIGKTVKLFRTDGSVLTGKITAIGPDTVSVMPESAATATTVKYSDITIVKGKGLSTGAKVGIGIGIGVVVVVAFIAISVARLK